MAVLPESMDKLDAEDTAGSLSIIENYIRYMGERIEFSLRNVTRNVTAAGVSSAEMYILLTALQNDLSATKSNIQALQGAVTGLQGTTVSLQNSLTATDGRVTAAEGSIASIGGRLTTVETTLTSLEATVSNLQSAVSTVQAGLSDLTSRVEALEAAQTPDSPETSEE